MIYITSSTSDTEFLASLGITVEKDGTLFSKLFVNLTQENLLAYAVCAAITTDGIIESRVELTIYGLSVCCINVVLSATFEKTRYFYCHNKYGYLGKFIHNVTQSSILDHILLSIFK